MSQVQSNDQAAQLLTSGDVSAIINLSNEEAVRNDSALMETLISIVDSHPSPDAVAKAAKLLVAIGTAANNATFPTVLRYFLTKSQVLSCSHDWTDQQAIASCRFHTNNLLVVVRAQASRACRLSGVAILEAYLIISQYSLRQLSQQASLALQMNVLQRLDHCLSAMFCTLNKDDQLAWIVSISDKAPTLEIAVGAFNVICGMLREVHLCEANNFELISSFLLWLPGMERHLPCDSAVRKCISLFARKLPESFWVASLPDCSEQPPFSKWWHVAFRICHRLQPSNDVMALMIASFQVDRLASLERVAALWRSLYFFTPSPRKELFQRELSQWLALIDDGLLCDRICLTFGMPLTSPPSTICHRMDRATQIVKGRPDLGTLAKYAAVAACLCPIYLSVVLKQLAVAGGDPSALFSRVIEIMEKQINSHPSFAFTFYEAIAQYVQNGGQLPVRDDIRNEVYSALTSATIDSVPIVPISSGNQHRAREDDLEPIDEMLSRIEDIMRSSESPEVQASIRERIKSLLQRS